MPTTVLDQEVSNVWFLLFSLTVLCVATNTQKDNTNMSSPRKNMFHLLQGAYWSSKVDSSIYIDKFIIPSHSLNHYYFLVSFLCMVYHIGINYREYPISRYFVFFFMLLKITLIFKLLHFNKWINCNLIHQPTIIGSIKCFHFLISVTWVSLSHIILFP